MGTRIPPGKKDLAFIDIETTGLHPEISEMISFAGQKFSRSGALISQIEFKILFEHTETPPPNAEILWPGPGPFSPEKWKEQVEWCLDYNHYKAEDWENAISLEEALGRIIEFLKGTVICGQNPHFDLDFIDTKRKRAGIETRLPYHKIDTVTLGFEHLAPQGLKFLSLSKDGGLCDFLNIPVRNAHEALDDVQRTAKVFFKLERSNWLQRLWWGLRWKMRGTQ